jgi:hypothetical protein
MPASEHVRPATDQKKTVGNNNSSLTCLLATHLERLVELGGIDIGSGSRSSAPTAVAIAVHASKGIASEKHRFSSLRCLLRW